MPSTPGKLSRALWAAACAGGAIFSSLSARASAPILTPKVLQCDGSFASGSITSHPTPTVRVEEQNSTPGLKIGQRRLSVLPSTTIALWRFDANFTVTVSSNYTVGCNSGCCKTWYYSYADPNGSASLSTGRCTYTDLVNGNCSVPASMSSYGTDQPRAQLGACPANPSTLPAASGTAAITPSGPLAGLSTSGLSAEALQLDGSSTYGTAANSTAWNLPATYTLAAWVNAAAVDGIIVGQSNGVSYWGLAVGTGGGLRHVDSRDATPGPDFERGSGLVGGWHLVHLVRRNGNDRRFYIDGKLVGTAVAASTDSFSGHPINSSLFVGSNNGAAPFLNGTVDDVRINNAAIGDDDIMLEWTTQMHKYSSNAGVSFSSAAGSYSGSPSNGTTATVTYIPGETYTANSRWAFTAQSIDGESALGTSYAVTIDNSPPIAPTLNGTATTANDITWSWSLPSRVCLPPGSASVFYQLVDAPGGATLIPPGNMAYPATSIGENIAGAPNQLVGRKLRVNDTWGSGLSAATSIYTLANPPLANSVVATSVSTGSALISWNQNSNPSYTRYQVNIALDPAFSVGVTTPVALGDDYTGSSVTLPVLSVGTTYYARVKSFSGRSSDLFGGASSVFISTAFTTLPSAPSLGGAPLSNVAIQWTWTSVPGALYYKLFDIAGSTLYTGGALSFTQGGLTTNTQYATRVEAVSAGGASARASASAFTLANDPTLPVVFGAFASSITYTWNGNLNPSYTFYEVAITTDASYAVVVTTLTVNATTATATGLFPGTTYFARLRSINGSQQVGSYVNFASAVTGSDPSITTVLAPPSAYVPPNGSVGQWHFDESTGTTAADTSGFSNTAALTCVDAACVSTPTFVAGPPGLGSAASFSGLANGFVRVPDSANYSFTDRLTVSAWVKPSSLSQPTGAGIVVRGSGTVENFALEVFGGLYRFAPKPGFTVSSTNTLTVGAWTHLIGVYDSAVGSATLYVNGRAASTLLAVPARTAANHDISIGNRQSGSGAYDRGFLGAIDSVRVQHRALNAVEALAEYEGSFVSTITPPSPNNQVLIGLAPNAFGAPATLFVSVDPFSHPITITASVLNAGLTVTPTGFSLVPNSIIEVVPIVAGSPFTHTLGSSASISMPYADSNGDNIIDNTNPPLPASAIQVYTLNTTINRWEALPTFVDTGSRRVTVFTPHFSVFGMFAPSTVGTSLAQVRVYPVPWKPGSGGRFDAAGITFDRLPASGSVLILNLAGERVRSFSFDGNAAGTAIWDGLTDGARRVASGVYYARITGTDGSTSLVKFAIER